MPSGLGDVRSYALYYGHHGEDVLARYDLAIVDPGGRTTDGVRRLKQYGTRALAYVSVLEVPQETGMAPPPHVLREGGQPVANTTFGNWVLDPRRPETRARLLERLAAARQLGYDGLFLDTIANVEDSRCSAELTAELVPAAASLVGDLHRNRSGLLVQNWGLHQLLPLTAPYLDGVCWESFPFAEVGPEPAAHSGIRVLQRFQNELGVRVLTLNEGVSDPAVSHQARDVATRCQFLWYGTSQYTDLLAIPHTE